MRWALAPLKKVESRHSALALLPLCCETQYAGTHAASATSASATTTSFSILHPECAFHVFAPPPFCAPRPSRLGRILPSMRLRFLLVSALLHQLPQVLHQRVTRVLAPTLHSAHHSPRLGRFLSSRFLTSTLHPHPPICDPASRRLRFLRSSSGVLDFAWPISYDYVMPSRSRVATVSRPKQPRYTTTPCPAVERRIVYDVIFFVG
ncbi:hypothetical protein B0H12DRAFT_785836 [Mycena haematopus]|nr:hypothetical protein B0H12DRAFT_785836 [Mycena haematopus]